MTARDCEHRALLRSCAEWDDASIESFVDWGDALRIRITAVGIDAYGDRWHYTSKAARDPGEGWNGVAWNPEWDKDEMSFDQFCAAQSEVKM